MNIPNELMDVHLQTIGPFGYTIYSMVVRKGMRGAYVSSLAGFLKMSRTTVTMKLQQLAAMGLIERDDEDIYRAAIILQMNQKRSDDGLTAASGTKAEGVSDSLVDGDDPASTSAKAEPGSCDLPGLSDLPPSATDEEIHTKPDSPQTVRQMDGRGNSAPFLTSSAKPKSSRKAKNQTQDQKQEQQQKPTSRARGVHLVDRQAETQMADSVQADGISRRAITDEVDRLYREHTVKPCGWGNRVWTKRLQALLLQNPKLTTADWLQAVNDYFASDDINPADPPELIFLKLARYIAGPLNDRGRPKGRHGRTAAIERTRQNLASARELADGYEAETPDTGSADETR